MPELFDMQTHDKIKMLWGKKGRENSNIVFSSTSYVGFFEEGLDLALNNFLISFFCAYNVCNIFVCSFQENWASLETTVACVYFICDMVKVHLLW